MAPHRRPDRMVAAPDRVQELLIEAACSRRRFLVASAAGTAGTFVLAGTPAGAVMTVGQPSTKTNLVVQPTPSMYFISRGSGSIEMKWGPVREYGDTVPSDRFYIHNRARSPRIDRRTWRLKLTGDAITRPRSFTYEDLLALPQVTLRRTLDCGANCAAFFPRLPPSGSDGQWLPVGWTQWHFGAVGAAEWTGVRARDVLAAAGADRPVDVKFTGLDDIPYPSGNVHYSQVIPADKVLKDDTLLVYRMNGSDLPADHGYPLRLLTSGWGANTAVKWLGEIEASTSRIPASGPQANQLLIGPDYPQPIRPTVGRVRSAFEIDEDAQGIEPGDITLHGRAWSGAGAIDRVDVAVEKLVAPGRWVSEVPWRAAKLLSTPEPLMWVRFEMPWPGVKAGQYRVMSRARDEAGNIQPRPEDVKWNQHSLGYNGHAPLNVVVLPGSDMP
ncbi:molybdopterin-dependent oxidoreductase [Actinomadura sp. HBU206391]|uniref:molybdopterin-dependent oxidoreductase n=1 Tax=Actinomadura sp. HBU206391 TaxID=2731692 RepID=UPI00164F50B1|nr:molybdopterin-dependent oxidoreductase [Actinomadura sp. HBU206391]MBC6458971.1 molybdopterin-dependent oxidoreductase [Actinomadura sp. HBU206391]